ncbi:DNA-directed 5'-3' RNA polymerase [Aureococcus anophagefferens]|uniref:DNA-directed 5'-3' RNA polymerase n=1 Tax=Aureococcus anophagefferens TaxID=44056 RepID=A0ABR1G9I3_AURAN
MKRKRVATLEPGVYRREAEFADPDDLQAFRVVRTRAGGLVIFALQTPQLTETQSTTYGGGGGFALLRRDFAVAAAVRSSTRRTTRWGRPRRSTRPEVAGGARRVLVVGRAQASPWRRGDPATWNAEGTCFSERHGVCFVAGQCEGSWAARSRPASRAPAAVWGGADDLIASMEPLILWRPWRDPSDAARTAGGWLHYDDDEACYDGRTAVQGLGRSQRHGAAAGGFVVVADGEGGDDAPVWRHVALDPGDLVCWASPALHERAGLRRAAFDDGRLLRVAAPICMVPRAAASPAALAERRARARAARRRSAARAPDRPTCASPRAGSARGAAAAVAGAARLL